MPQSHSPNPSQPPAPLGIHTLFSTLASIFLLCKYFHLYSFSGFHIYILIYDSPILKSISIFKKQARWFWCRWVVRRWYFEKHSLNQEESKDFINEHLLLQCSCLKNPRNGGAWWAVISGVAQSRTRLKWLSSSSSRHWWMLYTEYHHSSKQ